jgi:hypothetical protein
MGPCCVGNPGSTVVFIGFLPLAITVPRMSVFSPYVGIMTRATPSGRSPVDDFYYKWMVAAAVFLTLR